MRATETEGRAAASIAEWCGMWVLLPVFLVHRTAWFALRPIEALLMNGATPQPVNSGERPGHKE